ncbi:hypothetical protein KP001_07865 [Geomonas subterranea]|uniref:Bro-N domain-containing protein n=2 Tax=Geomonas subterranea TaxID=2847989 RepID=A0ABX8LP99_9BACT|nr:hypothetical protein KP001_07865 [Geomonas subterranea]QXM09472.1 hypothetical protein KP002_21405 [Geomonas subterranea]
MTKLCIILFGYDNAQTIRNRPLDGRSWYMAQDICRLLGISNYSNAVNKPFKDERFTLSSREHRFYVGYTGAAIRRVLMVNAEGLYKLIMQADPLVAGEIQEKARSLMTRKQFC